MAEGLRFNYSASVVLDGSGNGSVRLAPTASKWEVDSISVKCSTAVNEAQARVYKNNVGDMFIADSGTYAGSTGDTSDTKHYIEDGQSLYVVWTGGDAGATATAIVAGWQSVPARGFRTDH